MLLRVLGVNNASSILIYIYSVHILINSIFTCTFCPPNCPVSYQTLSHENICTPHPLGQGFRLGLWPSSWSRPVYRKTKWTSPIWTGTSLAIGCTLLVLWHPHIPLPYLILLLIYFCFVFFTNHNWRFNNSFAPKKAGNYVTP